MTAGTTLLALAVLTAVFAYLTANIKAASHGAVLTFINLTLTYVLAGLVLLAGIQSAHHTYLQPGLFQGFTNIYWIIVTFIFGWTVWHYYIKIANDDHAREDEI